MRGRLYANAAGIPCAELNDVEFDLYKWLNWELNVTPAIFKSAQEALERVVASSPLQVFNLRRTKRNLRDRARHTLSNRASEQVRDRVKDRMSVDSWFQRHGGGRGGWLDRAVARAGPDNFDVRISWRR